MSTEELEQTTDAPDEAPVTETVPPPDDAPEREADDLDGPADDDAAPLEGEQPPEPAPQPPEPTTPTPEDLDRAFKPVERSIKSYAEKITSYISDTGQPIIACGCCAPDFPGFIYSPMVKPLDESQKRFARELLGEPDVPPYVPTDDAHMCIKCDGWGTVLTGSKKNNQRTRICFVCEGRGWEGRGAGEVQATNGHGGEVALTAPIQALEDSPATDPWGRTPDHPGYYKMPHPGMPEHELPAGYAPLSAV
jgi:hypothetical protein